MRVMVFVKANGDSEAGQMPSMELVEEMGRFNEELAKAGVMVMGEGLHPSSKGARILFDGDDRSVVPGPFEPAEELVAGFWIWEVDSFDEAIEWAKRCPNPMKENGVLELRPIFGEDEFVAMMEQQEPGEREGLGA